MAFTKPRASPKEKDMGLKENDILIVIHTNPDSLNRQTMTVYWMGSRAYDEYGKPDNSSRLRQLAQGFFTTLDSLTEKYQMFKEEKQNLIIKKIGGII